MMLSEEMSLYMVQYQKVCRMLPAMKETWGWSIDEQGWTMPWEGSFIGFSIRVDQNDVTPEKVAWLWERECVAQVFNDRLILAPQMAVTPPLACFHTTLYLNVNGILDKGLLTAAAAGRSTSKRKDCEGFVYVSFSLDSARSWAADCRLGSTNPGQEWGIIMIDTSGITKRMFRDPCSVDGYILEDNSVAIRFLSLAERFSTHVATNAK